MKKKILLSSLLATATLAVVGAVVLSNSPELNSKLFADGSAVWHHYTQKAPTSSAKGVREYWVQCGGGYQFTAPEDVTIIDKGSSPDTSEFAVDDPRYINFEYDEDHLSLAEYNYGAGMYCTNVSDFKNWRATYLNDGFQCNLYSEGGTYLWRIDLPRIDYTRYPTVTMDLLAPNWYENNNMGPEADQLTYHTNFGGNKTEGKIKLTLRAAGLHMAVNSLEYASNLAFENTFTDSDIIHGLKSAYFYTEDLYDRYLNVENIALSTANTPEDIYSYAGDTTKLTVTNGTVSLPGSVDYSIINNGYGTNDTSLLVEGNANPGAAVITLPKIIFDNYTSAGKVTFKFGVRNNSEHMYFGSNDDNKVDLGTNSPTSQDDNNNGYVNWEMVITADSAYVHNTYADTNYPVVLTAGMRAGTESISIMGGGTSIYRRYLVTDFYWSL